MDQPPGVKDGTNVKCSHDAMMSLVMGRDMGLPSPSAGSRRGGGQRPCWFSRAGPRPRQCIKLSEKGKRGMRYEGQV